VTGGAAAAAERQPQQDKTYRRRDTACRNTCGLDTKFTDAPEDVLNCHRRCISAACYETFYGNDPVPRRAGDRHGHGYGR